MAHRPGGSVLMEVDELVHDEASITIGAVSCLDAIEYRRSDIYRPWHCHAHDALRPEGPRKIGRRDDPDQVRLD